MLRLGVEGKAAGWRKLRSVAADLLEELRVRAAEEIIAMLR
jgi:hypothetical protein